MDEIQNIFSQLLPSAAKDLLPEIIKRLEEKGLEDVEDLKYLNFEQDFKGILKEIPARKLKDKFNLFLNSGESSENINTPISPPMSLPVTPVLSPCNSLSWAEDFEIPLEKIPKMMKNKLQKENRLTPSEYRELVRILVTSVLEIHNKPRKCHLSLISKKLVDMFPIMKEIIDNKVIGSGYDGLLRKMIARVENVTRVTSETKDIKLLEKKTAKRSYGCINFCPQQDDVPENEKKKATLLQEYELLSWNTEIVNILMSETFSLQRKDILELQSIQKIKKEWPFLFISQFSLLHFKKLMELDIASEMDNALSKKIPELYDFLKNEGLQVDDPHRYLEALTSYFEEDFTSIIRIFEDNTIKEVSGNITTPASPYIAAFGDPYKEGECCIIFIDRVEASEFISLKVAINMWFASFYTYGLKYPEECPATTEFIQRAFLGINPEKGTKNKKRTRRGCVNTKVCRIIEKLCNFKSLWNT